jgi:hypothetical protein
MRSRASRASIALVIVTVVLSGFAVGSHFVRLDGVQASASAHTNSSPVTLRGNVRQIAALQDYPDAQGATYRDLARFPIPLTNVTYYVVHGTVINGQTKFTYEFAANRHDAGSAFAGGAAIAVNLAKHTQLVAVGIPTASEQTRLARRVGTAQGQTAPRLNGAAMSDAHGALALVGPLRVNASGYRRAAMDTVWYDPFSVQITEVTTDIAWSYNGSSVYNVGGWDGIWRNQTSGWYTRYWYGNTYVPSDNSYARQITYAQFENDIFCRDHGRGTHYTTTTYDPNMITGQKDGNYYGNVTTWYSDSCFTLWYAWGTYTF